MDTRIIKSFDLQCAITSSSQCRNQTQKCDVCYINRNNTINQYSSEPPLTPNCPPMTNIPFAPFSFFDMSVELDEFIEIVVPTLSQIANKEQFSADDVKEFYSFLNEQSVKFISSSPYPGYSRIITVMRTDGVVTVDKTIFNPLAIMIGASSIDNTLSNVTVTRQNTGTFVNYPSELYPVTSNLNLKVYYDDTGAVLKYDIFESFNTRTEFIQANTQKYGWAERPGVYVQGRLFCIARAVGIYGKQTLSLFLRLCYLRDPLTS